HESSWAECDAPAPHRHRHAPRHSAALRAVGCGASSVGTLTCRRSPDSEARRGGVARPAERNSPAEETLHMAIVHGVLDTARNVHLWAEEPALEPDEAPGRAGPTPDSPTIGTGHPFATRTFTLPTLDGNDLELACAGSGLELTLPTRGARPIASTDAR